MLDSVKVVVIGGVSVGKTSLTVRFVYDQFSDSMETTLGASYFEKTHDYRGNKSVKFQFWDTAGQEKYKAIAKIYYKDAKVAIVMYDVSSRQSFDALKVWMAELNANGPEDLVLAIVGNKIDKLEEQVSLT
jgi:Ras-related protein Rab-5C